MCGVIGFWQDKPGRWSEEHLVAAAELMAHRGPDARGTWLSADRKIGFAHRRLAIIDLSAAAHQPMSAAFDSHVIVFNGEIYNFQELRRELEGLGHQFRTDSDTEVIIAAYLQWGEACPVHLRGMFAFVIYDSVRRVLFMARDRAGEKPLFLYNSGSCFAFASELKGLMALPGFPRVLDETALLHYFSHGYVPGALCILQGVSKLPPAHAATYSPEKGVRIWSYWQLPAYRSSERASDLELEARLEQLLLDSVREQFTADVPVGILLSGGVDSSLIAAAAAQVYGGGINTYTVTFPGSPSYNEAHHARLVAGAIGSTHHELAADNCTFDLLPVLARQYDEPLCDSSMIPTYLLARMVRQHCTVALGGDGGDELFGGYNWYSQLAGITRASSLLGAPLSRFVSTCAAQFLPDGMKGRGRLMWLNPNYWANGSVPSRLFDPVSLRKLLSISGDSGAFRGPEQYRAALGGKGNSLLQKAQRVDFFSYLPEEILVKVDRASMLASLEVRAPFLDHRIIELAFQCVPDSLKCSAAQRKIITKRLVKKWLPADFDMTRKQGFSVPLTELMNQSWKSDIFDIVSEASPAIFNRKALVHLAENLHNPTQCEKIFAVCMFELWRTQYGISL